MKILNWNTEIASPRSKTGRFQKIRALIAEKGADIICLTEAYPATLPDGGYMITSHLSGWGKYEKRGARKVALWSQFGWRHVDSLGSERLPEGRFVSGTTRAGGLDLSIVGMCIPYRNYRNGKQWAEKRKQPWQAAGEYLDALRQDILPRARHRQRTVLLGDFNLQIPPKNYPYPSEPVNRKRELTFAGWTMPTAGEFDAALDKRFIDHVALTPDIQVKSMQFISRFDENGSVLSDHHGVCIEVE